MPGTQLVGWFLPCVLAVALLAVPQDVEADHEFIHPLVERGSLLAQAQPEGSSEAPAPAVPPEAPAPAIPSEEGVEEEPEEREVSRVPLAAVQQGGLLVQPSQLIVQPSLGYSFDTNSRLIVSGFSVLPLIILGTLEAEKVERQVFSPSMNFRYGLFRGLQLDLSIPVILQDVNRVRVSGERAGQVQEGAQNFGLGDISVGLSHQVLYERGWIPDLTVRLGTLFPTGRSQFDIFEDIAAEGPIGSVDEFQQRLSAEGIALGNGRFNVNGNITAVKALDPAILFGTLGYSFTPSSTETVVQIIGQPEEAGVSLNPQAVERDLGHVHAMNVNLGIAVSLNNQLSLNFSFSDNISFSTTADGQKIPDSGTNAAALNVGLNLAVSPRYTVNFSGQVGMTPDANDASFSLSVPISFRDPFAPLRQTISDWFSAAPAQVPEQSMAVP